MQTWLCFQQTIIFNASQKHAADLFMSCLKIYIFLILHIFVMLDDAFHNLFHLPFKLFNYSLFMFIIGICVYLVSKEHIGQH